MPLTNDMLRADQLAEKSTRPARMNVRERSYGEETITPESALTVSGVISILTIMAQDEASVPLLLYARRGRAKFRAIDSTYYRLMHDQPNPEHTSMVFREFIMSHLLAWGNFFAQKIMDRGGIVQELWPLRPDRMSVKRFEGERIYLYNQSDGKQRVFLSEEILHIPAFGFDGLVGYSRIALARNAIGLSISMEKYGSKFFSNGAISDYVYKHPTTLSDTAFKNLRESLTKEHTGVQNAHKPIILEEGMSIEKLGLPNDDAQFLESRSFQLAEINRILGPVPPHRIADVDRSTSWGSGIDSQEQGYINHTILPYGVRIEQALNTQVLDQREREDGYFYEHLFDAFLRGDISTRYEAYVKAITNGFMSRNEARERENLNPRKGLDAMIVPGNMVVLNDEGTQNGASNAFTPLWKDAITRVLKREANDLQGASKRWQAKGNQDEFEKWVGQFYRVDHPSFVQKQFEPLIEAQARLYGFDAGDQLEAYIQELFDTRRALVLGMSAEDITNGMETYIARTSDEMLKFVENCLPSINNDDEWQEEMEYE